VAIKRSKKKKKKLGDLRSGGSGSSEQSPRRPRWVTKTPPCQLNCPQGTDIRGILRTIADGEKHEKPRDETFGKVFGMLTENNPFPAICGRVCPHPCEVGCNRGERDEPASINAVERFVGDWGLEQEVPFEVQEEKRPDDPIAVIGAGPAGLSAAYHLAKRGYPVTVYEAFPKAGGMLRYGIPAYRLPRDVLDKEIQRILDMGVELKTNVSVGKDVPLEELRRNYKAVFVGLGAHKGRLLRCPGEDAEGVYTGTWFLNEANSGEEIDVGKKVVVVGGGDTAVDAARMARRMGAEVTILYRRTRKEMPAIQEEIDWAEKEGIDIRLLAAPIEILTNEDGRAKAMRCQVMELGEPDSSGRRRPVPIEGEEFTVDCDTVVAAISQEPDFTGLEEIGNPKDWVQADERGATEVEGVYAGGDNLQLSLVTTAIYQGRVAAETIDYGIRGIEPPKGEERGVIEADKMVLSFYEKQVREHAEELSAEEALEDPDAEIVDTLTEDQVVAEAARCMSCGECFDCGTCWSYCQDQAIVKPLVPGEPYQFKLEFCKGCDKCAQQCPCGFIEMYDPMSNTFVEVRGQSSNDT